MLIHTQLIIDASRKAQIYARPRCRKYAYYSSTPLAECSLSSARRERRCCSKVHHEDRKSAPNREAKRSQHRPSPRPPRSTLFSSDHGRRRPYFCHEGGQKSYHCGDMRHRDEGAPAAMCRPHIHAIVPNVAPAQNGSHRWAPADDDDDARASAQRLSVHCR